MDQPASPSNINSATDDPAKEAVKPGAVPNGGSKAWLQVLGAFFVFFNTFGVTNAFGVFEAFYASGYLDATDASISIVGALQTFFLLISACIVGPLFDHGNFFYLIWTGSFLSCFGMMMTSLCTQYYQVLLAQGLCVGLGSGCLFTPAMAVLSTYFTTRKNLAVGIAATGSAIGGIIYPSAFHYLLPRVGYPWSIRIIGFIMLFTCTIILSVMRVRVAASTKNKIYVDTSIFANLTLMLFSLSMFTGFIGVFIPFFYISSMAAATTGCSPIIALTLLLVMNGTSTIGRVVPGLVADKVGPLNVLVMSAIISTILLWCWIPATELGGLFAFAALYGLSSGAFVSLPSMTTVTLSPDLRAIGAHMGFVFAVAGCGVLLGQPVAGSILTSSGTYLGLQCWAAAALAVSAVLLVATRLSKTGAKLWLKA